MTSSKPLRAAHALGLALALQLALVPVVHAQVTSPTAGDLESARELFRRGKELRSEGELDAALEKFKAAHAYGQTPITGVELGRTHMQLNHLVEAREAFLSVARLRVAADETENSAQARREAATLAEQVRPMLATLEVRVGTEPGTTVTIDGAVISVVSGVVDRQVDPGKHVIVATAAGGIARTQEVVLAQGERQSIELIPPAAAPAAVAPRPAPRPAPARVSRSVHPLVFVGFGTAVAGLVAGGITGALALGAANRADQACGVPDGAACANAAARDEAEKERKSGTTVATVSTVSFVVAGVGAAVGVVGLLLLRGNSPAKPQASIAPVLGVGYAGVGGRF